MLKAGGSSSTTSDNSQESQFAILTSNAAYGSNNENNGLSTGYVVKLTAKNSEEWTVNGD